MLILLILSDNIICQCIICYLYYCSISDRVNLVGNPLSPQFKPYSSIKKGVIFQFVTSLKAKFRFQAAHLIRSREDNIRT